MKVFICEDSEIASMGLKIILERRSDIEVVGEARDGFTAIDLLASVAPDVVLMDIGLPEIDGIETTMRIKSVRPDVKILMITASEDEHTVFAALAAGADGYCLKSTHAEQLLQAIYCIAEGAAWLDARIAPNVLRGAGLLKQTENKSVSRVGALSLRESEVLHLLVQGMSNGQIAEHLVLSVETVKTHMRHVMEKLGVRDRTQAAVAAMRRGLIDGYFDPPIGKVV